jgi:DNA-binding NarL/FixJ family response regulator
MWIRIRAVIIEDEPLAAQYLAGLLDDTCQVEVVGTAAESEMGLRLCAELRLDAVFVDINRRAKMVFRWRSNLPCFRRRHAWFLLREMRTAPPPPSGWRRWIIF